MRTDQAYVFIQCLAVVAFLIASIAVAEYSKQTNDTELCIDTYEEIYSYTYDDLESFNNNKWKHIENQQVNSLTIGEYIEKSSIHIKQKGGEQQKRIEIPDKVIYLPCDTIIKISSTNGNTKIAYISVLNNEITSVADSDLENIIGTRLDTNSNKVSKLLNKIVSKESINEHYDSIVNSMQSYKISAISTAKSKAHINDDIVYVQITSKEDTYYDMFIFLDKDENIRSIEAY